MRFSIKYKLLFTFFITTALVVGSMLLLARWSFDRGFLQYINKVELETYNNLIIELSEIYKSEDNWESLRDNRRRWHELHLTSFYKTRYMREKLEQEDNAKEGYKERQNKIFRPQKGDNTGPILRHEDARRRFHRRARHYKPRTALLDNDKQVIVGRIQSMEGVDLRPIDIDQETVGYLAVFPRRKLSDTHDLRFSKEVGRSFIVIGIFTILFSLLVTLPLSRMLVRPVKALTSATRRLAAGEYSTRIPVGSNDELGELSRDFNLLANTLEQNEKARQQWIADISHELRTPLAVLRGEIEALQDGIRQPTADRLSSLHNEVMNLNRLIEDLYELSMSDIGALSYQKQDLDLLEVLESAVSIFREEFSDKGISLNLQHTGVDRISLFADPDRLQQLFSNLLTNSLRYTDTGGELEISVTHNKEMVTIKFSDSAPGVPPDELPRLFERLYRVDTSRSRSTGGAGLGLSICRNIVEAHDGTISAENSPKGGVTIKVEFPVSQSK